MPKHRPLPFKNIRYRCTIGDTDVYSNEEFHDIWMLAWGDVQVVHTRKELMPYIGGSFGHDAGGRPVIPKDIDRCPDADSVIAAISMMQHHAI
jgi:hypothetical protein